MKSFTLIEESSTGLKFPVHSNKDVLHLITFISLFYKHFTADALIMFFINVLECRQDSIIKFYMYKGILIDNYL